MRLIIGSRKSDLARIQAYTVGQSLQAVDPSIELEYAFKESLGDQNQADPLWKMPQRGVFTEDFVLDLEQGRVDLVVHSWKDLPVEPRARTEIIATLPRQEAHDVLLLKKGARPTLLKIFSSSPRRAYNLNQFLASLLPFPIDELQFENVRGNVPTRMRKLFESQEVHGLVVAKAALDRLLSADQAEFAETQSLLRESLEQCDFMVLPLSLNPCAPAQGALAIEIAKNNLGLKSLLSQIHCPTTFESVQKERQVLSQYGGGCHQKIGAYVGIYDFGEVFFLRGLTDNGEVLSTHTLTTRDPNDVNPIPSSEAYPLPTSQGQWFERVPLPHEVPHGQPLFVARDSAWPEELQQESGQIVVAAGVKTWQKLAQRGVWVTACSEGLGETHLPRLQLLLGENRAIDYVKLSHNLAPQENAAGNFVATYQLVPQQRVPDLTGKKHFYWLSGSAFLAAADRYPWIVNYHHYSGPGKTAEIIRKVLQEGNGSHSYCLNYEHWLERIKS